DARSCPGAPLVGSRPRAARASLLWMVCMALAASVLFAKLLVLRPLPGGGSRLGRRSRPRLGRGELLGPGTAFAVLSRLGPAACLARHHCHAGALRNRKPGQSWLCALCQRLARARSAARSMAGSLSSIDPAGCLRHCEG